MKIILPNGQEVELPENFSTTAYFSDDMFYEIAFFRKDVIPYVRYFCYTTDGMKRKRNYNHRENCCHDVIDMNNHKEGVYQICYTFDYDNHIYDKGEYEIRHSRNNQQSS